MLTLNDNAYNSVTIISRSISVDTRNRLGPQAVTVGRKWSDEEKAERCGG